MPNFKIFFSVSAVLLLSIMSPEAHTAPLKPVNISYSIVLEKAKFGNGTLGHIETSLSVTDDGYAIRTETRFQGFAVYYSGKNRGEQCEFQVKDDRALTSSYSGGRIGKKNQYDVDFDWAERKINFTEDQLMDMPKGYVVDNCVAWYAIALLKGEAIGDEAIYVVDGNEKRIRGYKHRSSTEVSIDTKLGKKDVVQVVFERELRPNRTLTFWLSPENQYLPLKIQESRKSRTTTFEVESLELLDS